MSSPLREARDLIAAGFCKHTTYQYALEDGSPQYCAVGAVRQALYDTPFYTWGDEDEAYALVGEIYEHLPEEAKVAGCMRSISESSAKWSAVVQYNNDPLTTQNNMVELFDKTLADRGEL